MNVIPGIVTNSTTSTPNSRHCTPNWLKALYAVLATLVIITLISALFGSA